MGNYQKRVYPVTTQKAHPTSHHAIDWKSTLYPFISPFLRDDDPQIHLPAADYILPRVQVRFGW